MDTVRKDLKHKIEVMEKVEKEKRKNNDIKIITSERDFFRQEAIRLNELCKELSSKCEEITRELKIQSTEVANLSKKWKESENNNKQLMVELERNIQINNELEFQMKMMAENKNNVNNNKTSRAAVNNINPTNDLIQEEENYENFNKEKLIRFVEKLKFDLKKERNRNHKILAEMNKIILDQNKLEKIFLDCVEESRKEIFNRKIKDSLINKMHPNSSYHRSNNTQVQNIPYINDIKFENFLPSDKRKLLEVFILKEEVINLIKDYVFKKIDSGGFSTNENKISDLMTQTKSSFNKTERMFSLQNFRKKTPSAKGITYTMQITRSKSPHINL